MPNAQPINLRFTGDYSLVASVTLAASAAFVDSLRNGADGEGHVLDLAFPLEGSWHAVGVRVNQHDGEVRAHIFANPGRATTDDIRNGLERMLSLDVDGAGFAHVVTRDEVVAGLVKQQPGVRPVLFPSPYEAAARAIIGHQLPVRQAAAINTRIAEQHGVRVSLNDHVMHTFPAPNRLADLPSVQGLAARKVEQLRVLGTAAAEGKLDSNRLRAMTRDEALANLQQWPGIGPFSAELVWMRGVGDADAFPRTEKRLHRAMAIAYHLGEDPDLDTLERVADRWHPYRNWVGLLLRNSISR